jgi:hypothetical protein
MHVISGQLYSKIFMNFTKVVTILKNWRIKNKKFGQVGNNTTRITFYEVGSRFYRSN